MTDRSDPRLQDESRLDAVKRAVEDVAQDAPTLAKIALEAMIREHNPDLSGTADSAGRVGMRSGKVSELTAIARALGRPYVPAITGDQLTADFPDGWYTRWQEA